MRKIILLVLIMSTISYSGSFSSKAFKRAVKTIPQNKLIKMTNGFKKSSNIAGISKKLKLNKLIPIDKLTHTAEAIAKKSPIGDKLMSSKDPLYAMSLYVQGGDDLFKSINRLSKNTMKVNQKLIREVRTKIPDFPKIPKYTSKQLIDRTVTVAKATGKNGIKVIQELGKIAMDNPKSAIAGLLYGWYLSDPEGFKSQLDGFGGSLEEFSLHIGTAAGTAVLSAGNGFINGAATYVKEKMTMTNLLIVFGLFLAWILYRFRDFFKFIGLNIQKGTAPNRAQSQKDKKRGGRF